MYIVKNGYYCKFCSRNIFYSGTGVVGALHYCIVLAYGAVVSMFDFHRIDRGSNPGRGG